MSNMNDEVLLSIVTKFLNGTEMFELIKKADYKGFKVYFVCPKEEVGKYVGRPIYVLIDELGKARYATYEETCELMMCANLIEE